MNGAGSGYFGGEFVPGGIGGRADYGGGYEASTANHGSSDAYVVAARACGAHGPPVRLAHL